MVAWLAPVLTIGASIYSGYRSSQNARNAANAANDATERQFEYDTQKWEMSKDKLVADREYAIQQIMNNAANERRLADFKDATNLQNYNYELMIRNREQASLNQQFRKSNKLFRDQISLNAQSAIAATEEEYNRHRDVGIEAQFNEREAELEYLITEGKMRARGMQGRSVTKASQATYADFSRRLSLIDATVDSSGRAARSAIEEIARDKTAADLAAYAQKMLDPGQLPMPLLPFATPVSSVVLPRALEEYDFGPEPVKGAIADPSAAAGMAWGTAISNIAAEAGRGLSGYYGQWKD